MLGEYARERRIFVPAAFIPKLVKEAFTSAEDRNFYSHPGIDPSGILRAAIKDVGLVLEGRRPQGASTITQQVARNFLLNSDVKFSRKIREAILAIRIDATYPKEKVLELYLNEIYLGENSYGVGAAALNYFGKSLDELDIAEVAFLAALPKAPSQLRSALQSRGGAGPPQLGDRPDGRQWLHHRCPGRAPPRPSRWSPRPAPWAARPPTWIIMSRKCAACYTSRYGAKALYDGGLQVRASLDTRLQNYAVSALRTGLVRYDRRHGWRGAKMHVDLADWKTALAKLADDPNHQSGIETWRMAVALDYRRQGRRASALPTAPPAPSL